MSIQSDTEKLFIQTLESYAASHGLTGAEAIQLFQKNQVFEKIPLQHELQLDFDQTNQFVDTIYRRNCFQAYIVSWFEYRF